MLERTAASLEPCNFQRVLPPAKTPFKSRRRLHTAFWQHGAADVELSNVWHTLVREPLDSLSLLPTSQPARSDSPTASNFLDFLYPQGAALLLRKLSPSVLDKYERSRLYFRGTAPRLFTSSASVSQQARSSAETGATSSGDRVSNDFAFEMDDRFEDVEAKLKEENDEDGEIMEDNYPYGEHVTRESAAAAALDQLRDLLKKDQEVYFRAVWGNYFDKVHPNEVRTTYRDQVLDYAAKHRSMSSLLALCLKHRRTETILALWARWPEAHNSKALDWKDIEDQVSVEQLIRGLRSLVRWMRRSGKSTKSSADPELYKTLMSNFIRPCIYRYTMTFKPEDYFPMLRLVRDPLVYENFLAFTTTAGQRQTSQRQNSNLLYREYRKLPQVKIRGHIMHKMIELVYGPDEDAVGMELVLEDFYARFGRLDIGGYRRYMEFYARRGDVKSVQRFWDEYIMHYAEERKPKRPIEGKTLSNKPDFLPMLHVHAVRGELGEVRRIFDEAQATYGAKLNVICWNILLNAHAKAGAYDGAVRVFSVLKQAVTPDLYSYGTMMGMTGSRGDLEFTLELYRMAKNDQLKPNITLVDCVVEAYCQNEKFNDAESIVVMTTEKRRFSRKDLTILWNTLLYHHSSRRDLKTVNRLLGEMSKHRLDYDGETYAHLLRGLALCKQPHHALFLIQQAVKSRSWKPTLQHYALLMSSFLRSGKLEDLFRTSTVLRSLGIPPSGEILLKVLQALSRWATRPPKTDPKQPREYLLSALRQFRESIERDKEPTKALFQRRSVDQPWIKHEPQPPTVSLRTEQANVLIFTFTQMREVTTVQDILQLWRSSSPEISSMPEPPIRLLEGLMFAALHEHNYAEVKEIWTMIFDRVVQMSRVSAPGTRRTDPLPSLRYVLNEPLKTIQRMYALQDDADGLRETVKSVLRAGFRLDSKNWNYYVQFMVSMKKWREAFMVCEEQLMPFWRGWQRVRSTVANVKKTLPLDMRRMGSGPHFPRPISYTLTVLSRAYMDLESMAAWSGEAEQLLNYIVTKCPSAMSAVRTQLRTSSRVEEAVLRGNNPATNKNKQAEKESETRKRRADEDDDDIPEGFKEMMELAGGVEEAAAGYDQGDWLTPEEAAMQTRVRGDAAGPAEDGDDWGTDGEWDDVSEQEETGAEAQQPKGKSRARKEEGGK